MNHIDILIYKKNTVYTFPSLGRGIVTSRDQSSSASPQFYINFNFSCQQTFYEFVFDPDVMPFPKFVRLVDQPLLRNTVRVDLQQFTCFQKTTETINEELKDWPMEDNDRPSFIRMAIKRAQRFIQSMPPHHNVLDIDFRVVELESNIYNSVVEFEQSLNMEEEEEKEEWVEYVQRLMESEEESEESEEQQQEEELEEDESSCFMVPTTDSCIECLERTVINGDCLNCAICLEEFPAATGCEVVSMPCSHIFHGDCIQLWLKTSHYCPVCRFEMPTE